MDYLIKGKENIKCDVCRIDINDSPYWTILQDREKELCVNCYRWYSKELFSLNIKKFGLNKFDNSGLFAINNNIVEREILNNLKNP
jgi:hypothetical protein